MQIRSIHLFIFCIAFSIVQFWFAIGGIGLEFKGSWILMAPFRNYFLNWFLLMFAVFWANRENGRYGVLIFILVMFLHYTLTVWYVVVEINKYRTSPTEEDGLGHVLARYPGELIWGAVAYATGNLVIWALFIKRLFTTEEDRQFLV